MIGIPGNLSAHLEIENPLMDNSFNAFDINDNPRNNNNNPIEFQEVRTARKEAFIINIVFFLCSLSKVVVIMLLFTKSKENCYGPLFLWLILMFIHDLINVLTLIRLNYEIVNMDIQTFLDNVNNIWNLDDSYQNIDITLHSYIRQQIYRTRFTGFDINNNLEKLDKCLSIFIELCRLFYFVLFVYGNVVFFSDSICSLEKTPFFWGASLMFLFMGYIYLAVPLLIFSVFCFCLPFILIFFLCFSRRERGSEAREKFLNSLKPQSYTQVDEKGHECCICMIEYQDIDEVIVLPCNKKHSFHANCVRTWLSINGVCPICRKNFVEEPVRNDNVVNFI